MEPTLLNNPESFSIYKGNLNKEIPYRHQGEPTEYPCLVISKLNYDRYCRPNEDYTHTFFYSSDVKDMAMALEII